MKDIKLKTGGKYTLIHISKLGICFRREFTVISEDEGNYMINNKGPQSLQQLLARQVAEGLVFEGHNLPVMVDSDTPRHSHNARFNFISESAKTLRVFIVEQCLNLSAKKKDKIWSRGYEQAEAESQPLFADSESK